MGLGRCDGAIRRVLLGRARQKAVAIEAGDLGKVNQVARVDERRRQQRVQLRVQPGPKKALTNI